MLVFIGWLAKFATEKNRLKVLEIGRTIYIQTVYHSVVSIAFLTTSFICSYKLQKVNRRGIRRGYISLSFNSTNCSTTWLSLIFIVFNLIIKDLIISIPP